MDARNFTYMFYGFSAAWVILAMYALLLTRDGAAGEEVGSWLRAE